jgi:hypothetical protein
MKGSPVRVRASAYLLFCSDFLGSGGGRHLLWPSLDAFRVRNGYVKDPLRLDGEAQLRADKRSTAFKAFLDMARDPTAFLVRAGGRVLQVNGSILA